MDYREKYNKWLAYEGLEESLKKDLLSIESEEDIKMRFEKDLEFGTGGLRGIMGAGTNNMNVYTVRLASRALADYLNENKLVGGVAIAFDCRNNSALFAMETAKVLAAEGIKVYIYKTLRPTPQLSFTVRHLSCSAGVVITASHNTKEYNGYKVYGSDGAQVVFEVADAIKKNMSRLDIFSDVSVMEEAEAVGAGLINYIGDEVDREFEKGALALSINPEIIKKAGLKLVYSPFNGAGNIPVRRVLKEAGLQSVFVVPEQENPDGNFPTLKSPNPENFEGFAFSIELAKEKGADLIIATDPDSDRVGVAVKKDDGSFINLTGNQTGALLAEYILSQRKEMGTLSENGYIIKTVVTNEIANKIAAFYGAECFDVLTGFKFIADKIKEHEDKGDKEYIFGFEESYGYLCGDYVRDKDAVSASLLIAEMASSYKMRGMTLYDGLTELYQKYGKFGEWVDNIYFKGADGMAKMSAVMESIRENLPKEIGGSRVVTFTDILKNKKINMLTGEETSANQPSSNVLRFETEDGSFVAFRPSGTEPKFKIYSGFFADDLNEKAEKIKNDIKKIM